METLARFRAELGVMEEKLTEASSWWKGHLARLTEETEATTRKQAPPISRTIWPTRRNFSEAVYRLGAINKFIDFKKSALKKRGETWDRTSIQQHLLATMLLPPVRSETVTWQSISAIADAEDNLEDELSHLSAHESAMTDRLRQLEVVLNLIKDTLNSNTFATECALQEETDQIETFLMEDANPEHDERSELQDTLEKNRKKLQSRTSPNYGFLYFGYLLSDAGIKTARQTLICEFFDHSSPETDEDIGMENDTEVEDGTAMEDAADMEIGSEVDR